MFDYETYNINLRNTEKAIHLLANEIKNIKETECENSGKNWLDEFYKQLK